MRVVTQTVLTEGGSPTPLNLCDKHNNNAALEAAGYGIRWGPVQHGLHWGRCALCNEEETK